MSFRNFDNRDRYYDREGNVLCGCLQFMIKDGTTVANIYDGDMVALANPQVTDILGRTKHQVFVDSDVLAYVYKYVGTGTLAEEEAAGIDTSDESKWSLQYTLESTFVDTRTIDGESAMGVPDIDALRALDVSEVPEVYHNKIVTLHGYYNCGDCEPVSYLWDGESTLADDNGSVIQPDGVLTGRWILVQPTEHCDSRHFGVFPQDSADVDIDQSTRITQLISYCNTRSIRPYFNGSQAYPYFIYNNVAYNSRNPIDVSNDTIFVDKGSNNRFYGEWNGNPYFQNANTQVNSKTVRHSWHFGSYGTGTVKYIVDSTWSPVFLSNIDVVFEVPPASNTQLTDCELSSNEKITREIVLQGMTIHTDWFADNYNWGSLSIYNCTILLQNCKDADTYVRLKNKQNEADYGDLGEQTVSNQTLLPNCIAENGAFSNVTLSGNSELHNISGTASISGSAYDLNFIDCWLYFSNTENVTLSNIQWRRGSFSCAATVQVLTTLSIYDADVNVPLYTPGAFVRMERCNIYAALNGKAVVCKDCHINAQITTTENEAIVNFNFDGCYFGPNGIHAISSSTPSTRVTGVWSNNFAETQHPIQINMTNIYTNDSAHQYTYSGNSGKFMQRYPVVSYTQSNFWRIQEVARSLTDAPVLVQTGLQIPLGINSPIYSGVWIPESWAPQLHFFSIGPAAARIRLTITFEFTNTTDLNDDMTPRVNKRGSVSADTMVLVSDPSTYTVTEFGNKILGNAFLGPKNITYPAEITTREPATWPTTNSAHITIERLL